jgi:peptidoglycan/LPS O-acetylase OafA/YrhL
MLEKQPIFFIHLLRGLAPVLVMWCHFGGLWTMANGIHYPAWDAYLNAVANPLHIYQGGGHLGVAVFFLISGFIISHVAQHETRLEFAVKRLFRLIPPLAFAILLMYMAAQASLVLGLPPMLTNTAASIRDYIISATLLNYLIDQKPLALSLAWSLYAEVIFYCIVAALIPMLKNRPVASVWIMIGVYVALLLPMAYSPELHYLGHFSVYLPMFIVGRIFYLDHTKAIETKQVWTLVATSALLFCLLYSSRFPGLLFGGVEAPTIVTYLIALVAFFSLMQAQIRSLPKPIMFLADISYALYLVHVPVGVFAMNWMLSAGLPVDLVIALGMLFSVGAAAAMTKLVDKPSQILARRFLSALGSRTPVKLVAANNNPAAVGSVAVKPAA